VTKIGVKTAAKLLRAYHSLDGVMAGAGILKDTLGERLRKEHDNAFLSRALVQPKIDVQIGITWRAIHYPLTQE
jgi:protein Xni